MTTAKDVMKLIKDNDVKYVDFRFTDPRGKWQHVTFDITMIEEDTFAEGIMFDGSSIAGWKAINESDMNLMPDPATACIDPFFAETTLVLVCDVLEPTTGEPYNRDPRGIAKKAEAMVKSMGPKPIVFAFACCAPCGEIISAICRAASGSLPTRRARCGKFLVRPRSKRIPFW